MGYYTMYTLTVPDEFMSLWGGGSSDEVQAHINALKSLGVGVTTAGAGTDWVAKEVSPRLELQSIEKNHRGEPIQSFKVDGYLFEQVEDTEFSCHGKFYEANAAFEEISSNVDGLFTLDCAGEDGESWRVYFKGGKSYSVQPQYPDFDESKLK